MWEFEPILALEPISTSIIALLALLGFLGGKKMDISGQKSMQKMGGKLSRRKDIRDEKALMALKERESAAQAKEREFQMEMRELGVSEGREKAEFQRSAMEAQGQRQMEAAAVQALNRPSPRVPLSAGQGPAPQAPPAQMMDLAQLAQLLNIPMSQEMRI